LGCAILCFGDDVLHNITGVIAHIKAWIDGAKE
jgi:hypothetical protein